MDATKWCVVNVEFISVGHVLNRLKAINILQKTHCAEAFLKLRLMMKYKQICSMIMLIKNIKCLDKKLVNNTAKIVHFALTASLSISKMIKKLMI